MAENSLMWTTDGTGDGTGSGYTMAELVYDWLRKTFIGDETDECVLKGVGSDLAVSDAGGTDVNVVAGAAYVYGFFYYNTSTVTKTLSTPAASNRIDRIVLEADWTAQTVRITVVEGAEGSGSPPSLTQTEGTEWQVSLAQVEVTPAGDIDSVTDERVYLHPNIEVETAMLEDEAVTGAKIADGGVDTTQLADDSVDDTKAGDRMPQFYRRQGGAVNNWDTPGSTDRTPGAVRMQGGSISVSFSSSDEETQAVTFPTAFSSHPLVICGFATNTVTSAGDTATVTATSISDSGFTVQVNLSANETQIFHIHWLAIGPE